MSEVVFSPGDLAALTEVVADAWRLGADRSRDGPIRYETTPDPRHL